MQIQTIRFLGNADNVDGRSRNEQLKYVKYLDQLCQNEGHKEFKIIYKSMYQQSELYIWLVILMSVFYGVPAIQLVLKYQVLLRKTGNNDLCYYNFLCSIPVNKVLDFNHIISNIGYMAFGITFLIIVWYKKYLYNQLRKRNLKYIMEEEGEQDADGEIGRNSNLKGTPQHFGIFFALGLALFAEGALSACYHVCPTNENFQFDTTFMYTKFSSYIFYQIKSNQIFFHFFLIALF